MRESARQTARLASPPLLAAACVAHLSSPVPRLLTVRHRPQAGCVDRDPATGLAVYKRPKGRGAEEWTKLTPGTDGFGSSSAVIAIGASVKGGAKIMGATLLPFLIIQMPAFFISDPIEDKEVRMRIDARPPRRVASRRVARRPRLR